MSEEGKIDIGESLKKSVLGDKNNAVIQAGTLAVTRGAGMAAAGLIVIYLILQAAGFEGWESIPPGERIWLVVATGGVWALLAAGDTIARGLATAKPNPPLATFPEGLKVTNTKGRDEPGWTVVAVRWDKADGDPQWLIAKGEKAEWVATANVEFPEGEGEG